MFEYVNEVIINSEKDALSGLDKFQTTISGTHKTLRVLRVGDYDAACVVNSNIYKTTPEDAQLEEASLNLTLVQYNQIANEQLVRVYIEVSLSNSAYSKYTNAGSLDKVRPVIINIKPDPNKTSTQFLQRVVDLFNLRQNQYKNVDITLTAQSETLTAIATNGHQHIKMSVQKLKERDLGGMYGNTEPKTPVWEDVVTSTVQKEGKESFGTYQDMMKNVQIQTSKRTNVFSQDNNDSRIIPGTKYTQYVFDFEHPRDITGMGAVGQKLVSITKAIFWIADNIFSLFEAKAKEAGLYIVDVRTGTSDPARPASASVMSYSAPIPTNVNEMEQSNPKGEAMALAVGESESANITISQYDTSEVTSGHVVVDGVQITGESAGSDIVKFKKGDEVVYTVNVVVS